MMNAHSFTDTVLRRDVTVSDRDMDDRDAVTIDAMEKLVADFQHNFVQLIDALHRPELAGRAELVLKTHDYLSDLKADTTAWLLWDIAERDTERRDMRRYINTSVHP